MTLSKLLTKPTTIRLIFGGVNFTLIILSNYLFQEKMGTLLLIQYIFNVIINVTCLTLSDLYYTSDRKNIYIDFRTIILMSFSMLAVCNILNKDLGLMYIMVALCLLIPLMIIKSWVISRLRLLERYIYWILLHYGLPTFIFIHIMVRSVLFEGDWPLFAILIQSITIYFLIVLFTYIYISQSDVVNVSSQNKGNNVTMFRYIILSISLTLLPFSILASNLVPNQLFILRVAQSVVSPIINVAQVAVRSDLMKRRLTYFKNKRFIIVLFISNVAVLVSSGNFVKFELYETYLLVFLVSTNLCIAQLVLLFVLRRILSDDLTIGFRNMIARLIVIGISIVFLWSYAEVLTAAGYAIFLLILTIICFSDTLLKTLAR